MPANRLEFRAAVVRQIRAFFDDRGFVEVETPVRIAAPAPEPHIDCPPSIDRFLRASPELQMKKLLAAGMDKIYQLGPCFRLGENGRRHSDEFTMLEWYRKGAGYLDILSDMEELLRPWTRLEEIPRITVREAYLKYAGWDPFAAFDQDRFDLDMATKVEPNLGGWVFLMDYPPECASLAKLACSRVRSARALPSLSNDAFLCLMRVVSGVTSPSTVTARFSLMAIMRSWKSTGFPSTL